MNAIIPIPRSVVSVRPGTLADLPFIDGLQKANSKNVGFLREKALEGKIGAGHVLIAENVIGHSSLVICHGRGDSNSSSLTNDKGQMTSDKLGYCIGNDRYMKREDVGIIYQLNVAPGARRKLIGATLIQALFARSAYGCRLFCCWCAQDIEANHFWEALGFIPLAFRAGSAKKSRVHIFWQRRIREGDTSTPWWFPSQTSAGSIGEDRLVLPIPPGTHWSDAKPIILPRTPAEPHLLTAGPAPRARKPRAAVNDRATIASNGLRMGEPEPAKKAPAPRQAKRRVKNDPGHVAAVRELRDRYLEQFNAGTLLPGGKYDVSRAIVSADSRVLAALPAAA